MKNKLTHFAIHTDDVDRARQFYDRVFNWGFNAYGHTDFLQITADKTRAGEIIGALQSRKYSPVAEKLIGLECTIGVENLEETIERITRSGGHIIMPRTAIPTVGWLVKFLDTEGNLVCAMQYDTSAR